MAEILVRPLRQEERVHHIDGNGLNNSQKNLHLCRSVSHHRRIHAQLESVAMDLVHRGKIVFKNGKYTTKV